METKNIINFDNKLLPLKETIRRVSRNYNVRKEWSQKLAPITDINLPFLHMKTSPKLKLNMPFRDKPSDLYNDYINNLTKNNMKQDKYILSKIEKNINDIYKKKNKECDSYKIKKNTSAADILMINIEKNRKDRILNRQKNYDNHCLSYIKLASLSPEDKNINRWYIAKEKLLLKSVSNTEIKK